MVATRFVALRPHQSCPALLKVLLSLTIRLRTVYSTLKFPFLLYFPCVRTLFLTRFSTGKSRSLTTPASRHRSRPTPPTFRSHLGPLLEGPFDSSSLKTLRPSVLSPKTSPRSILEETYSYLYRPIHKGPSVSSLSRGTRGRRIQSPEHPLLKAFMTSTPLSMFSQKTSSHSVSPTSSLFLNLLPPLLM